MNCCNSAGIGTDRRKTAILPHAWSLRAFRRTGSRAGKNALKTNDAVAARGLRASRNVWDNPVLWREVMTWAYGRKVLFVRLFYSALVAALAWGAFQTADGSRTSALDWVIDRRTGCRARGSAHQHAGGLGRHFRARRRMRSICCS